MDTDADRLADVWETTGMTNEDDKVDLTWAGVNPTPNRTHKDLFVEVDVMQGTTLDLGHLSSSVVFDLVRGASDRAPNDLVHNPDLDDGITLHVVEPRV